MIGMFLGGAGLADTMLYCRDKIYPLGPAQRHRPRDHGFRVAGQAVPRAEGELPAAGYRAAERVGREQGEPISGRFSLLAVTTLEKLLLSSDVRRQAQGTLKLLAIEERPMSVLRASRRASPASSAGRSCAECISRRPTRSPSKANSSNMILDGETFRAEPGRPINLRPAQPLSFVKLAA